MKVKRDNTDKVLAHTHCSIYDSIMTVFNQHNTAVSSFIFKHSITDLEKGVVRMFRETSENELEEVRCGLNPSSLMSWMAGGKDI